MEGTSHESRFDTRLAYHQAIEAVVASARREICIFDPDLKNTELDTRARSDQLVTFLAGGRDRSLRIVLHDTDYLSRYCPRLMGLLARFSHSVSVRVTPDSLRQLADCFMVADRQAAVIRFHADHFRGKLLVDGADDVGDWRQRFEDLWQEAVPGISATHLGL